jgi:hypothetical protein
MRYYARVVFEADASVAEKHDSLEAARRWIETERDTSPESFRLGQIVVGTPDVEIVATFDLQGWKSS